MDKIEIQSTSYIGGRWLEREAYQLKEHYSPIDGQVIGHSLLCGEAEVNLAVSSTKEALNGWAKLSPVQRGNYLFTASKLFEEHAEQLAQTLTLEMGKPIGEARGEVGRAVALLRYYAGEGMRSIGEVLPATDGISHLYTTRVPLGVVGLITPWNFPVAIPIWKIAPALIYGNTVVWKAADHATITAAHIARLFELAGLPTGVVNLLSGPGSVIGNAIVAHRDITGISFTGSDQVGKAIAMGATERGAKYQLEMGGKNASIVLADADLPRAADTIVSAAMRSSGQKCTATSRVIVEKSIADTFTQMLVERVKAIKLSDPRENDCYLGPVVTGKQRDSILAAIQKASDDGATLLTGGGQPQGEALQNGCYVEPTVFKTSRTDTELWQEEIFGPVIAIVEADHLDHAIELANSVRYGLAAGIFTQNYGKIHAYIHQIEAGLIKVNGETAGVELQAPFGGMKQSSSYSREQGRAAIEFFTQIKTVVVTP